MEWSEAIKLTGEGSPYNRHVVEKTLSTAQAIVVLLTGDDMARIGTRYLAKDEPEEQLTLQVRPNVMFEAGMAFGVDPKRTILVELGKTRDISDMAGMNAVRIDNTVAKRQLLASRLKTAGCDTHYEDQIDWHSAGDFEKANLPPDEPKNMYFPLIPV